MSRRCTRPNCPGTIWGGHCDYCGFAPPRDSAPVGNPGERSSTIALASPVQSGDSGRTGPGGTSPYGPLEMAGVPPIPYRDPEAAVLPVPEVAESRRYCSGCNEPVGRRHGNLPAQTEGVCPNCRTRFSFTPKLRQGELVSGQYEVRGCLAHGGLGWIYLAHDNNVGHWVVLKGLLDTGGEASNLPTAERAALAQVNHPNIVKIHNFVHHPAPATATRPGEPQSYIVMEYVGGRSLKELLEERQRAEGPAAMLEVDHVIAYGIEMLRALGYLHEKGLLYCDLKPANVMQCEQRLTLIDMGAAWRMTGTVTNAPVWGTFGYRAPEVAEAGPTISSDLYTVGRTMAVLSFPFDFTGTYANSLPPRDEVPVLDRFESYYRLLCRATHPDPARRFASAAEMVEQLRGVLREVVSVPRNSEPWPMPSTLFGRERRAVGTEIAGAGGTESAGPGGTELADADPARPVLGTLDVRAAVAALPVPVVTEPDEAAGGLLADLFARDPAEIVETLSTSDEPPATAPEARLVLAGALLDLDRQAEAERVLDELAESLPGDWRVSWYRGLAALAADRCDAAMELFDELYTRMPGEAAPKLALAFCCERVGDRAEAARRYESVWRTDHGYVSAAFGLARVRLGLDQRVAAVTALDDVSALSSYYGAAQLAAMAAAVRGRPPAELTEEDLLAAEKRLAESRIVDGERRARLAAELLEAALARLLAGGTTRPDVRLLDAPLTEDGLRRALEGTYRTLARFAEDGDARHALVTKANKVRPRTWV
ncbi:MAG TPA: tetratricopeptide repeat protein [Streptosporangiaceae bacterium]|nr:tetratricopeptide repeat protein [Streptosporangiaceae bacterium]